jgi:hypothetical protein
MTFDFEFPDAVARELERAGWSWGRSVDIFGWEAELGEQGYRLSPVAAAALRSFGGLVFEPVRAAGPNFSNDEPLTVDPVLAGSGHFELACELASELGGNWYPFGEWLSFSSVFVEDSGWVVATGLGWIWELGKSVGDAITFALAPERSLKCLRVLAPDARPWPAE